MHFESSAVVIWVRVTGSANIMVTKGKSCGPMPYSGALQDIAPEMQLTQCATEWDLGAATPFA